MPKKIAVDDGLGYLSQSLYKEGYEVVSTERRGEAHCVITCGVDTNFAGMEDIQVSVPVINANGKSPAEVIHEVKSRIP